MGTRRGERSEIAALHALRFAQNVYCVGGVMSTRASHRSITPAPVQVRVMSPAFSVAFEFTAIVPLNPFAAILHAGTGFGFITSENARTHVIVPGPVRVKVAGCATPFSAVASRLWTTPTLWRCACAPAATAMAPAAHTAKRLTSAIKRRCIYFSSKGPREMYIGTEAPGKSVCAAGGAGEQQVAFARILRERGGAFVLGASFSEAAKLFEQIRADTRQQVILLHRGLIGNRIQHHHSRRRSVRHAHRNSAIQLNDRRRGD